MAFCKFCGSYTDRFEWPEEYREYSRPDLCFACYRDDPSRGLVLPEIEASLPQPEKPLTLHEEEELDHEQSEEDEPLDGREDIFPDVDDGCATEDDDNEDNPDDY